MLHGLFDFRHLFLQTEPPSPTFTKMEFLNRAQKQVFADETDLQNPIESIPSFQIPQVADVCSPLPITSFHSHSSTHNISIIDHHSLLDFSKTILALMLSTILKCSTVPPLWASNSNMESSSPSTLEQLEEIT